MGRKKYTGLVQRGEVWHIDKAATKYLNENWHEKAKPSPNKPLVLRL